MGKQKIENYRMKMLKIININKSYGRNKNLKQPQEVKIFTALKMAIRARVLKIYKANVNIIENDSDSSVDEDQNDLFFIKTLKKLRKEHKYVLGV